jgi:glyoxylase-like metal-dependent hydrolase (beta-lactamase superfamily II)
MYPFIDYSAGGSMEGMIADADQILKTVDAKTKIIPGHGPMGTREDLKAFRDMLAAVNEKVSSAMKGGKTLEQLQAAEPTKDYDAKWGNGFLKPADFVRMLHMGKSGKQS